MLGYYLPVFITSLGDYRFIFSLLLIGGGLAVYRKIDQAKYLTALVSVGMTSIITKAMKLYFAVPRPVDALLETSSHSFPSGHSALATAFYFLLFLLYRDKLPTYAQVFLLVATIFIPLSRLFLNVHRPFEVVVGSAIGLIFTLISYGVYRKYLNQY